jgi:NADP-dependent 3-hydroxy acid dehydrogenase YdfG
MSGSVAIVTGAGAAIGKATALRLAPDFGAIVLAARGGEKLGEVGEQVKAIGAEAAEIAGVMASIVSPAARRMTGTGFAWMAAS